MHFTRIYDDDLAHASYLVGCQRSGDALVIDPRRDIDAYLHEAQRNGLRIRAVTETHIHADYLSGARELAAATGATLHLSAEGGDAWTYRFEHEPLRHGDVIEVGNVRARAVHTPGHTPEHLMFLVTDGAAADEPGIAITGDFVFVGDLGRPDLLDESALERDTREPMARRMHESLLREFLTLPDWIAVWPGHGAGSPCGKALGAVPSSTVGYERRFAWWRAFEHDPEGFVRELLAGQPEAPSYFARMKRTNRDGPPLLGTRDPLRELTPAEATADHRLLLDTRTKEDAEREALPGSLFLPFGKNFSTWAAWFLDPEGDDRELVLLAPGAEEAQAMRDRLARVGIDRVAGYVRTLRGLPSAPKPPLAQENADRMDDAVVLDVRARSEYDEGHIPGALQIPAGQLRKRIEEVPRDRTVVVHCQAGNRSAAAVSLLRGLGFDNVLDLEGGFSTWQERHPGDVERSGEAS